MLTFSLAMGRFFSSTPHGLVFLVPYPWGSFAPSAFPSTSSGLRCPPRISHENTAASRRSLQKIPMAFVFLLEHVENFVTRVMGFSVSSYGRFSWMSNGNVSAALTRKRVPAYGGVQ
jgi:hypothetical protein